MTAITYSEVQELVRKLPETKLSVAYKLLAGLAENATAEQSPQIDYLILPLAEKQLLMSRQADEMRAHYEQMAEERELWQGGDFIDAN